MRESATRDLKGGKGQDYDARQSRSTAFSMEESCFVLLRDLEECPP